MASKTTSSFFFLSLLAFLSIPNFAIASNKITAIFAFGDSTVDAGNNNHLNSLFRGDHLPYGCDFPNHVPTGRFSNGKISTDYLSQFLGIKDLLPAFLDPQVTDNDLLTGVSFGSGGSGLVWIAIHIGTNDMLENVYMVPTSTVTPYGSISSYQDFLLQNLQNFIQRLYGAGGRRIMVAGLPPIGCLPIQVTFDSILPTQNWLQRVCNVQQNIDSQNYNAKLQSNVHLLQATLQDAKIAYFDIYTPILDMVLYPAKYGFGHSLLGCCGTGVLEMGPVCNTSN
ncbi:GDSL Lipase/Acylhydrolase superfamily protein [Trifolium repens]|nr:GDSL Lipase/Acylhydrolase superfamily protein [Trifolium repens]